MTFSSAAEALRELVNRIRMHPVYGLQGFTMGWSAGSMTNGIRYCIVQVGCPDGEYHIEASGEEAEDLESEARRVSDEIESLKRTAPPEPVALETTGLEYGRTDVSP